MRRPCTKCPNARVWGYTDKIFYEPTNGCWLTCDKYIKYEAYKESRRMYRKGELIKSMPEFMRYIKDYNYIYWNGKLYHIEAIKSWAWRMIETEINRENFIEAILKGEPNEQGKT